MSSTEAQPPSPPNTFSPPITSFQRKLRIKQKPPAALDTQSSRRKHDRSSSFADFLSRILPTHREEKGHTQREQFKDDGTQDPVALVFGLPATRQQLGDKTDAASDGSRTRKMQTWSPRKSDDFGEMSGAGKGGQKRGGLTKIFGSLGKSKAKEVEEGEVPYLQPSLSYFGPSQRSQVPAIEFGSEANVTDKENEAVVVVNETTKAQQMFEDKKTKREKRRSLRESDDFLGVQGANPRTGYWDVSDGTSSSQPSQLSDETKRKLDEKARELVEQKRRYEEAQAIHQTELERVQILRENKKKEKKDEKKAELKAKQRRYGKWKLSEDGWNSVAEPELSPIQQSLAGSPVIESAPFDRLFPMPSAADPTPYVQETPVGHYDYFGHRIASSPLAQERSAQSVESELTNYRNIDIRRKPVGSPIRRQGNESSETIIRTTVVDSAESQPFDALVEKEPSSLFAAAEVSPAVDYILSNDPKSTSQQLHFLEREVEPPKLGSPRENEAIAISSPSASMRQAVVHQPLAQSPKGFDPGKQVRSMNQLPPAQPEDPTAARILLSSPPLKIPFPIRAPPTISKTELPALSTNISTITTTGCALPRNLPVQFDGLLDIDDEQARQVPRPRKASQIPLRTSSQPKVKQNATRSNESQAPHQADTAILSEHQLNQTKQRTARLCQTASLGGDKGLKSIPISTSTFLASLDQSPPLEARNAARQAFHNLRHDNLGDAIAKAKSALPTPRDRETDGGGVEHVAVDPQCLVSAAAAAAAAAARAANIKGGATSSTVVWHSSPEKKVRRNAGKPTAQDMKAVVVHQGSGVSRVRRIPPRPERGHKPPMPHMVVGMAQSGWRLVEPVFNSGSAVRRRLDQRRLTWHDIGLFSAAALFSGGMFLMTVVFARALAVAVGVVRTFMAVFRLISGI